MRIAYVAGTALPSRVASAVNVLKMARSFARQGHEVRLFARASAPDADPATVLAGYGVEPCFALSLLGARGPAASWPGAKNLLYPLAVARALRRGPRPDLLYGRHPYALAAAAAALPGVPFAYEAHALPLRRARRAAEAVLLRRPRCLGVVAISAALAADYRDAFPGLRVQVAHDGADLPPNGFPDGAPGSSPDGSPAPRPEGAPVPPPWPGRKGAPRLGYAGHLYPGKGMELVAALAPLLPECDLHVLGGTEADLAAWRVRCGALPNLFLHGFAPHARVAGWLAACDLLLVPPLAETRSAAGREIGRWMSPLKAFEAMAAGRPILASDIPVLREVLEDGRTALLVPPGDSPGAAQAWAVAARRLLADPALAARLGSEARAALATRYSWDARAARILAGLAAAPAERPGTAGDPAAPSGEAAAPLPRAAR